MGFFSGSPAKRENVSTLLDQQNPLFEQLMAALQGKGAGGAFGNSADYFRNLLSDDSEDYKAFSAPMLRQYYQDILPGLSEQFAGMGAGGLSSSGFQNAQVQGATDLSERLGALRANLRQQGAQGLQNLGQLGLGNYSQNMETQPGSEGFLSTIAPLAGTAIGSFFGGPAGGAAGNALGQGLKSLFGGGNSTGANTSPYGANGPQASPKINNMQLPNFMQGSGIRGY